MKGAWYDSVFVTMWNLDSAKGHGDLPYQESNNTEMYHAITLASNVTYLHDMTSNQRAFRV